MTPDVYLSFVLVLSAPGFGVRPSRPALTPLTASLNFLTVVVIRWVTGLVTGPPGEAAFGVLGVLSVAFAVRTVLLWPLVAAASPREAAFGVLGLLGTAFAVLAALPSGFSTTAATSAASLDFVKAPLFEFPRGRVLPPTGSANADDLQDLLAAAI